VSSRDHLGRVAGVAVAAITASCIQSAILPDIGLKAVVRPVDVHLNVQVFRLDNGMRVALVPDRRTNLVAVDVRYTSGALDDGPGKSGLAHLVEHTSFGIAGDDGATLGERLDDGALSYNAYTSWDETHFSELALATRLPELLAIEAARMGAPCERIAAGVVERERDVVENELREKMVPGPWAELPARLFGARHPYARSVGGAEVTALTADDVCAFRAGHYAPGRAILVVSGDLDAAAVRADVERLFGPIRRPAAPARRLPPVELSGRSTVRGELDDPTLVLAFASTPWGQSGHAARDLAIDLWVRRIQADGDAVGVRRVERGFLGSPQVGVELLAVTVADPSQLGAALEVVLGARDRLLDDNFSIPRRDVRSQHIDDNLVALDRFEGIGGRVADYLQYTGHLAFMLAPIREIEELWQDGVVVQTRNLGLYAIDRLVDRGSESPVLATAIGSLPRRDELHVSWMLPSVRGGAPQRLPTGSRHVEVAERLAPLDLSEADHPLAVPPVPPRPPAREVILGNGLRVVLAPVPGSPLLEARLVFPVGLLHESFEHPGVALLAAYLLDHDMGYDYPLGDRRIVHWALGLGTRLTPDVGPSSTVFRAAGAARYADWHLWRLFWLIERGIYAPAALDRVRAATARHDNDSPRLDAVLARALLGNALVRERNLAALARLRVDDLDAFRTTYYAPGGATLILVGGFDPDAMLTEIERLTQEWRGRPPQVSTRPVRLMPGDQRRLAILDDQAPQVSIALAFPATTRDSAVRMVVAEMVAAQARSVRLRIGATYGLHADYTVLASAAPALVVGGDADPARAGDVLNALLAALDQLRADPDAFARAFVTARRRVLARVLARVADTSALADELEAVARDGTSQRQLDALVAEVANATPAAIRAALTRDLDRDRMVIALAGPHAAVQAAFQAAKLGDVHSIR